MKNTLTLYLFAVIILTAESATAQSMSMQMDDKPRNRFLLMMDTMMSKMARLPKPASVESDFNLQMIAHHQGAVAMARYEISHGRDFTMIQLAKSILASNLSKYSK